MLVPDLITRLKSLVPKGWFANQNTPLRDAVFGGIADALGWIVDRLAYAKAQTRIATASGFWLDLIAWDFFAARFMRRPNEADDSFRPRILKEILRPRATRAAISQALTDLTGREPTLIELFNPGDCGGYGIGTFAYGGGMAGVPRISGYGDAFGGYGKGGFAYVVPGPVIAPSSGAGCYGSLSYPNQIFLTALRSQNSGIPNVSGYGASAGGYGAGALEYVRLSDVEGPVTDDDIYAAAASTVAAGVTAWTAIEN